MADAQATFVATLDSSGIQQGARSGLTALERLGQQIQKRSKDLAALKAAQQRLVQSAGVQEYLKRQKAIEKAEQAAAKVEKNMLAAQERLDKAKSAGASSDEIQKLSSDAETAKAAYDDATAAIERMRAAQEKLTNEDTNVKAYRDQAKVIKATDAELADLQGQYSAAGGSATDLASEIKEPTKEVKSLMDQAKAAGGPIGDFAGKLESLGSLAKSAGPLALVAIFVAIGIAIAKATVELVKFGLASANAARDAARMRSNAAFGSTAGTKDIESTMAALRANTALAKTEAQGLAAELYRLGDRGPQLEDTAVTIARFGQLGEEAQGNIKGFYDELRKPVAAVGVAGGLAKSMVVTKDMLPRDVFLELATQLGKDGNKALLQGFTADKDQIRAALSRIGEQKFAGPALEQMRSLDKLSERFRENLESLFAKVKIGILLGALQKLVGLLDESSESGKAIREVLGVIGQAVADAIESALPYIEAFLKGIVFTGIVVALIALKIEEALSGLIPESLTKNIDWLEVAFWSGAIAMGLFTAASLALAATLFVLALPFLTIIGLAALFVLGIVMAIDAAVGAADEIGTAFESIDFAELATSIIDGLIGGLADGAASLYAAFVDLAKGGYAAFKNAILSKSPSRLFRMAGQTIPQGTALGIEDETPKVENAIASMASPSDMVTPSGGSRNGSGGTNFVVQAGAVVIQVQSAEEINSEGFIRQLGQALAGAAREGGVSPEPETA
jgi:hypothetical protein